MFQIRQCRPEDFEAVVPLLRQLWPEKQLDPTTLQTVFARALASETQAYFCATTNAQQLVAFGSLTLKNNLWHEGCLGHIDELVVDSHYRGRGIGTQLLTQLVTFAGQKGCRRVELDSAFHRLEAHEFYKRHGFVD